MVPFRRVVVDYIQNHFQTGGMKTSNHCFEFRNRTGGSRSHRVASVRRKKSKRVVAPVIREAPSNKVTLVGLMNWHQLYGRYTEILEMTNGCFRRQAGISSSHFCRKMGMQFRETLDMDFVNHRLMPRDLRMPVVPPGKGCIDQCRQGGVRCIIPVIH